MDARRQIPSTDRLLRTPELSAAQSSHDRETIKAAVRAAQQSVRTGEIGPDDVVEDALARLSARTRSLRPVINATGIVVHTNLGRAPLAATARQALLDAAGSTPVEFDVERARRGRRGQNVLDLLVEAVPEAGDALVVNNNAAALVLVSLALAGDREIVTSKGELVEIGDGFRLPEILSATGARLREVGTTNRTVLADYAAAVTTDTGFILKVHQANFTISGYTESASIARLATLSAPLVADLGSGLLRPHPVLPDEPDVASALRDGADLVTISADKLLGGPQAGLILGRGDLVEKCRRHPIARALRVDKLTLAALEATLLEPTSPVMQMIIDSYDTVRARACTAADDLASIGIDVDVIDTESAIGGGGAPGVRLPSAALRLPVVFAARLRRTTPPVIGRIERDHCLLDVRTVLDSEMDQLCRAVRFAAADDAPGR